MNILINHKDKVEWRWLCQNANGVKLLSTNLGNIDWIELSKNPNSDAIDILKNNLNNIDWNELSCNPSAIDILRTNVDRICWKEISTNTNIFTYNYEYIQSEMYKEGGIGIEIIYNRFHPKNIPKFKDWGLIDNNIHNKL
jgi:hypothetical protein